MRFILIVVVSFFVVLSPALAQQQNSAQKSLGTFGVWQAFAYKENDAPVCYMVKEAKFPTVKNAKMKRGPAFLMITHRPGENTKDVVSFVAGYNFRPATDVDITIGKETFDLFTSKDTAWSRDSKTDHALAAAIRNGGFMKVSATPAQTNMKNMTDNLDLKGAAAAYQAIGKACGYEADAAPKAVAPKKKSVKSKP